MDQGIVWLETWEQGVAEAGRQKRPMLICFHNPRCPGCLEMDARTYPDPAVQRVVQDRVVPLRVSHDHPTLSLRYHVESTPWLTMVDPEGAEHHRILGVIPPPEFVPDVLLGVAKTAIDLRNYPWALSLIEEILRDHGSSQVEAEAVFRRGQALHRSTLDPGHLRQASRILGQSHPGSSWAAEARRYRLL